jgi:hypothetical protein
MSGRAGSGNRQGWGARGGDGGGGCGVSPASPSVLHPTACDTPMVLPGRTGGTTGGDVTLTVFLEVEKCSSVLCNEHGPSYEAK